MGNENQTEKKPGKVDENKNTETIEKEELDQVNYETNPMSPIERIKYFFKKFEEDVEKYSNPSKLFRKDFFIGLNQKINEMVFFDNGREKPFKSLEERKKEGIDAIFDTTVCDPQNDKVLFEFLEEVKKKFEIIIPHSESSREDLDEKMKKTALDLISEVINFFGGLDSKIVTTNCEREISSIKQRKKSNLIFLGELKGFGVCRHRSILFKLLCDIFNIPCRILRGWFIYKNINASHMWNEIVLSKATLTVDCMNFPILIPSGSALEGELITFMNLGHPQRSLVIQRLCIERIRKLFTENDGKDLQRGKHLGVGAFGEVYEVLNVKIISDFSEEKKRYEEEVTDLAIKEVNLTAKSLYYDINKIERMIKREIKRMTLLQHPNVVQIIGSFSTIEDEEMIVRLAMKKYDMNGEHFMRMIQKRDFPLSPQERAVEILIILLEVAKGLKYIHSFGVIHFDIKLENILLNWDSKRNIITEVVISDFGSSKEEKMNFNLTSSPNVTRKFAAPEILKMIDSQSSENENNNVIVQLQVFTQKSDIYSFGVVMSFFMKYLGEIFTEDWELKLIEEIHQKCLNVRFEERPEISEIIEHLRNGLNNYLEKFRWVFTWGFGGNGTLGHGNENIELVPKLVDKLTPFEITKMFCGYNCCSVLLSNGNLLSWGYNKYRLLGHEENNLKILSPSKFVELPQNRKIIQVSNGYSNTLFLDDSGDIWGCGDNSAGYLVFSVTGKKSSESVYIPIKINISNSPKITKIITGWNHFGCICSSGNLYTWGSGLFGKLGHGNESSEVLKPKIVEFFRNIRIKDVSMGYNHTLVLSEDGKLYSFGWNYYGQLGWKPKNGSDSSSTPGLINYFDENNIIITNISAGDSHSGALDSDGNCYIWGYGVEGQIGNGKFDSYNFIPFRITQFINSSSEVIKLDIPNRHKFVSLDCGKGYHNICILEEKTEQNGKKTHVLTWGRGKDGRLGLKNEENVNIPTVVPFFENKIVKSVCAGGYMSAVIL